MTPSLRPQPAALDETLLEPKPTARTTPGEAPIGLGADACYWAILEHLPDRLSDYALLAAFEQWLPLPIDEIEARFVRLGDGKVIACGVEHALLQSLIEQIDDVSLCPTTVPAFVQDAADGIDVAKMMEFRRGQYVPSRMAHRRRRQHAGAIALALVTCVIVAGGFWLRAQSAQAQAHAATMATSMLVDAALGLAAGAATGLDPAQRLDAALRVVNQTQQLGAMAPGDQAPNYGQLLA
ncbi:MAG: hypothetical protein KDA20_05345, partial [Phycisphaerales bacterium]|nr:hypothetical protein [Phycisphaerales bacterium]